MADNNVSVVISAVDKTREAFSSISRSLNDAGNQFGKFQAVLGGLGLAVSAVSFGAMIKGAIDAADHLNDLSKQTGVAVNVLGGLGLAAKSSGVDLDSVAKGMGKFAKNMVETASGSGEAQAAFEAMGISVKDASGNLKSTDAVLKEVAGKFALYEDGPAKAALAIKLFGKSGAELIPMLDEGSAGLNKFQEQFEKYGGVTKEIAQQSDDFNDKLALMKMMSQGTATTIAAGLLPTMSSLVDGMIEYKKGSDFAENASKAFGIALQSLVSIGMGAAHVFSAIGKYFGAMFAAAAQAATGNFSAASEIMRQFREDQDAANQNFAASIKKVWAESTQTMIGWTDKQKDYARDASIVMAAYATYPLEVQQNAMKALSAAYFTQVRAPMMANKAAADELKKAFESAYNTLGGDVAKLEAEIEWMEKYGDSVAFANKALLEFETTQGKLRDQPEAKKALLIDLAAQKDNREAAKKQLKEFNEYQRQLDEESQKQDNEYANQRYNTIMESTKTLEDETRKLNAEMILDDRARALAQIDIEKEKWLNIIDLAETGSGQRKNIEDAYQKWLSAKIDSVNATEYRKYYDSIEKSLTDALMRGFESGKDFASNFKDTLVNMFKTLVLRPVIQPIAAAGAAGVLGMVGMSPASASGMNLLSTGSNLNSLFGGSTTSGISNFTGLGASSAAGTTGTGLYGSFATSSLGQSLGLSSVELGLDATGGTAVLSELGAGLGVALPWVGGALAIASLLGGDLFGGGGGDKIGSNTGYNTSGQQVYNYTTSGGDALGADKLTQATLQSVEQLSALFGKKLDSAFQLGIDYQLDPKGDSQGDVGYTINGQRTGWQVSGQDTEAAKAQIQKAANMAIIDALKALNIGDAFNGLLGSFDSSKIAIGDFVTSLLSLTRTFEAMGRPVSDLSQGLIEAAGGIQNLQQEVSYYYQNFYTEAEKQAEVTKNLTAKFAELGYALPQTKEGFRALVDSLDLTTTSGQQTYAALMGLAPAFASISQAAAGAVSSLQSSLSGLQSAWGAMNSSASQMFSLSGDTSGLQNILTNLQAGYQYLTDMGDQSSVLEKIVSTEQQINDARASGQADQTAALQKQLDNAKSMLDAAKGIESYLDSLKLGNLSTLSPEQKLHEAESQYAILLAQAKSGDATAAGKLQESAAAYLTTARDYYASSADYAQIFGSVTASLDGFATTAIGANETLVNTLETSLAAQLSVSISTYDSVKSLYQSSVTAFAQQLDAATKQIIATDSVKSALDQLPPELAGMLSASIAGSLGPVISSLSASMGSRVSTAGVDTVIKSAATGNTAIAQNATALRVEALYETILGRTADAGGLAYWTNQYSSGALNDSNIVQALVNAAQGVDINAGADYLEKFGGALPKFAAGGYHSGGWAMVGEEGPELAHFDSPARIYTAGQTRSMTQGQSNNEPSSKETVSAIERLTRTVEAGNRSNEDRLAALERKLAAIENETRLQGAHA